MKVLFIGGTGNISSAVSRLALSQGIDLYLLNRGKRRVDLPGARTILGDINQEKEIAKAIDGKYFDVIVNWIAFVPGEIERDIRLFRRHTSQYIFISSASIYQKPPSHPVVSESTPLANPFWQYSRDKIACEERLNRVYREEGFPMTIVRPSHTYDTVIPVAIGSWDDYTIIDRMKNGKKIIVHGDGTSLWTITHSEDFARGFVPLMGHQQAIGQSFHITSDESLNWNQIYQAVAAAADVEAKIVHIPSDFIAKFDEFQVGNLLGDKAVSTIFDNSKIKRFVPGYVATIPFNAGIKRTIEWFEKEPSRMRIKPENNHFMDQVIEAYEQVFESVPS